MLNRRQAIKDFIGAYITITILGTALSFAIGIWVHSPSSAGPLNDRAYIISEYFDPFLNLMVWSWFAGHYFRRGGRPADRRQALALGRLWLGVALVVDFVCFVLIKNPISLSPHDFYIGQFPWIYLIYVAVLFSPVYYLAMSRLRRAPSAVRRAPDAAHLAPPHQL